MCNKDKIVILLRNQLLLSQMKMGKELDISFSTFNCWKTGKYKLTIKAKRKIISLCQENDVKLIYKNED